MSLAQAVMVEGCRRRTERVKREKPNYYDASEYEKKTKKVHKIDFSKVIVYFSNSLSRTRI